MRRWFRSCCCAVWILGAGIPEGPGGGSSGQGGGPPAVSPRSAGGGGAASVAEFVLLGTDGAERKFALRRGDDRGLESAGGERIPWTAILGLQRAEAPEEEKGFLAILADGTELRGEILGKVEAGEESFRFRTRGLGILEIPLDDLKFLVAPGGGAALTPLRSSGGDAEGRDLCLFRRPHGFDPVYGFLEAIGREGVRFALSEEEKAELHPWKGVAAVRLEADPPPPVKGLRIVVATRGGSLVSGKPLSAAKEGGGLVLEHPFLKRLVLPFPELVSLHVQDRESRTWLSDLEPLEVVEESFFKEVPVLFPWRRDRSVVGTRLSVAGRVFTKGIGAHSRSRLRFRIPPGSRRFLCWFGVDDTARRFRIPGNLDFRIEVDGKVAASAKGVQAGSGPLRFPPVEVGGGRTLDLVLDFGEDLHIGDRGDWLYPVFLE